MRVGGGGSGSGERGRGEFPGGCLPACLPAVRRARRGKTDRAVIALTTWPLRGQNPLRAKQDQLRSLRELAAAAFGEAHAPIAEIYDGDTPRSDRDAVRGRARLLITNPDMLHVSVLPVHAQFASLLSGLRYVVVDEGHAYKGAWPFLGRGLALGAAALAVLPRPWPATVVSPAGVHGCRAHPTSNPRQLALLQPLSPHPGVFGAHTAMVLRRLRRLCEQIYGSRPTFVVTSATIANPGEHAARLLGSADVHGEGARKGLQAVRATTGSWSGGKMAGVRSLLGDQGKHWHGNARWPAAAYGGARTRSLLPPAEITIDGSPTGPKQFVLWNPPLAYQVGGPAIICAWEEGEGIFGGECTA